MSNAAVGMPCPVCRVPLVMSDRQGVEIDYCPQCRGVWLDRGELDKIIERSSRDAPQAQPAPAPVQQATPWDAPRVVVGHAPSNGYSKHGYPKRRKSFLEELFD